MLAFVKIFSAVPTGQVTASQTMTHIIGVLWSAFTEWQSTGIETIPRTKQVPFWRFLLGTSPGSPSELLPLCPSAGGIGHGEEHEVPEDCRCVPLLRELEPRNCGI